MKIVAAISHTLFRAQEEEYQERVLSPEDWADSFVVSNTARWNMNHWIPHAVAADYALTPDHDDRWRTGGSVDQIVAESELDEESLKQGVLRFIADRDQRFARMNRLLSGVRASEETDDSIES